MGGRSWSLRFPLPFCFPFCTPNSQEYPNSIDPTASSPCVGQIHPEHNPFSSQPLDAANLGIGSKYDKSGAEAFDSSFVGLPVSSTREDTPVLKHSNQRGNQEANLCNVGGCDHTTDGSIMCLLPTELLHQIFLYTDANSLVALSSVNHTFQSVSERILYRNIGPISPRKTIRCLKALVSRPSLASHTRSYEVGDLEDDSDLLSAFFSLLSCALHNMTRLTELAILLDGAYSDILVGCPFRLTKLTSALHWDDSFTQWVQEQPELRIALFCGRYVVGTEIEPQALPNLTRISASPLILAAVVPGRPIKEVEICLVHPWLLNEGLMSTTMKIMTFSTGPLTSLQIISHLSESTEDVLAAVGAIPRVVSKLDSLALHAVSGSVTMGILSGFFNIISEFSTLRSVMILSKNKTDALHNSVSTAGLAAKWHEGCNSLECVSFPEATWVHNRRYGWLTLKDLERILFEREKALLDRERDISEREQALGQEHKALEEKERRLEAQIRRLGEEGSEVIWGDHA